MGEIMNIFQKKRSLRWRLVLLILVAVVPFLCITIYLVVSLLNYSRSYDEIVSNMTVANSYNLEFKEQLDESTYKLVVGAVTYESIPEETGLKNPYVLIDELRRDFTKLMKITTDRESLLWLQSLLRNLDTLEARENDIRVNLQEGGHYDENIAMLDTDIYILTELVQDDLQHYIYYQAKNIETLKLELNRKVESFFTLCVFTILLVVIIILAVAIQIAKGISTPIHNLVGITGQISEGDFKARAPEEATQELNMLSDSVNTMAQKLELFVEQMKEDERKMRRGELRLLQEQINPHFLYNTLDTIVWLIEGNMTKEAEKMVVSLSDFFRLILNHGKEMNSIEQEEKHIRSYLEIQQVRYQDILEYEIAIPEELYHYSILKMTLQPIVENALYHGIKYKRAKGKIFIHGRREEDSIVLVVEDNGVGMDEAELKTLQSEIRKNCKETEKGFGLANVNERIKMAYGPAFGLSIESEKGKGTRVSVRIAVLEGEANETEN